jgi:hypothetical protein
MCLVRGLFLLYQEKEIKKEKKIGWLARKRNKLRKTIWFIPVPWANGQLVQSKIAPTIEQQG